MLDDSLVNYDSGYGNNSCNGLGNFSQLEIGGRGFGGIGSTNSRGVQRGVGRGSARGGRPFVGGRVMDQDSTHDSLTGHSVHMRGLPYSATEQDIARV
jgi:heterogeneous nuclear ribonucleoprotein F/H